MKLDQRISKLRRSKKIKKSPKGIEHSDILRVVRSQSQLMVHIEDLRHLSTKAVDKENTHPLLSLLTGITDQVSREDGLENRKLAVPNDLE